MGSAGFVAIKRNEPLSGLTTTSYETIEYIAIGSRREIAKSALKKCLEQPGFFSKSKKFLQGKLLEDGGPIDLVYAREN